MQVQVLHNTLALPGHVFRLCAADEVTCRAASGVLRGSSLLVHESVIFRVLFCRGFWGRRKQTRLK